LIDPENTSLASGALIDNHSGFHRFHQSMNVHHLELFYYVARHGGIAAAVRNIPYGIQQPAVSAQIARLEESLGVKLFQRRPFLLTAAGADLFEFIEPFFGKLEAVEKGLRAAETPQLRVAAPSVVLHDYMPDVLQRVRGRFPNFRLHLHEAARVEAERLLTAQEIDFAITLIEQKTRPGLRVRSLIQLPLVLLVPKRSRISDARQLWEQDKIEETLITFLHEDPVQMHFQRELQKRHVDWFCGIEVNSARLIECYVGAGHGIGLAVAVPGFRPAPGIRVIPLADFAPVNIGVVWSGKLSLIAQQFLAEVEAEAKTLDSSGSRFRR
jgi:DNA-binding transcriptional LysR family regulator